MRDGLTCLSMTEPSDNTVSATTCGKGKSIWDNDLPPGDAPPMPRWPLTVSIVAYSVWMVFLLSMMVLRITAS